MRAHDVGIGLAVAWANLRRRDGSMRPRTPRRGQERFIVRDAREDDDRIDRGPVVEPEPLTDTRVAFGSALAQENRRRGWYSFVPLQQFRGRLDVDPVGDDGVCGMWPNGPNGWATFVDLDPRRWPQKEGAR